MRRFLVLAMLLASFSSMAESIYRTTDADGNVVFTDAPTATSRPAEPVELNRTNTTRAVQISTLPDSNSPGAGEAAAPAYAVTIISPENETSFPMGPGNFSVSVSVSPALKKYEGLQLFLNGVPWGTPQRDTLWDLINVLRGQQDLSVAVVNTAGETLGMSAPVRVFVHRPSSNFRAP